MTANVIALRRLFLPLFAIQFLSWGGMFCLWVYAVPVITHFVLHAPIDSGSYRAALIMISGCFAYYGLLSASLAFVIPGLVDRCGAGIVHGGALIIGGIGISSLGLIDGALGLPLAFTAIGIGWSSMSNIPYAIASGAAPKGRGAHFIRVFAFSTVVPQVVMTIALAAAAAWWGESGGDRVLVAGGILMATGGLLTLALRSRFDVEVEPW